MAGVKKKAILKKIQNLINLRLIGGRPAQADLIVRVHGQRYHQTNYQFETLAELDEFCQFLDQFLKWKETHDANLRLPGSESRGQ